MNRIAAFLGKRKRAVFYGLLLLAVAGFAIVAFTSRLTWMAVRAYKRTIGRFVEQVDFAKARARLHPLTGEKLPLAQARIVIRKADKIAELYDGVKLIKKYPVVFGGDPQGPKTRIGDRKTPEGQYHLCTRLDDTQFHLFLGINYPNSNDATRAMTAKIIDQDLADKLFEAEKQKQKPDWESFMGGAIGLHGGGVKFNWTNGCIAFDDRAIEEIWLCVSHWTPVEIAP